MCPPVQEFGMGLLVFALPAIQRIPPALPGLAEVIRRHSGNKGGRKILGIKGENILVGPDIGTVESHVDGKVPE